jgi:hypothetical protein
MIICILMRTQTTLTREALMNLGQNYIPLAPDFTSTGGLSFQNGMDFQGITIPLFKSRPANEDNSIVAKGYAIADFNIIMNIKVSLLGYQLRIY